MQGQMINRILGTTAIDRKLSKSLSSLQPSATETPFRKTENVIDGQDPETAFFNQTISC
jgi:hypothetical protein